jgi:hypothetical protein
MRRDCDLQSQNIERERERERRERYAEEREERDEIMDVGMNASRVYARVVDSKGWQ